MARGLGHWALVSAAVMHLGSPLLGDEASSDEPLNPVEKALETIATDRKVPEATTVVVRFRRALAVAAKQHDRALEVTLQGALRGDDTKSVDAFQFATEASFAYLGYPTETRFRASTSFTSDSRLSTFKENVTRLVANVEYHPGDPSEVFGFAERFTDSYMQVDQRYEVGVGVKLRLWKARLTRLGGERLQPLRDLAIESLQAAVVQAYPLGSRTDTTIPADVARLESSLDALSGLRRGLEDDPEVTTAMVSISAAVLTEFEKARLKVPSANNPASMEDLELGGRQRYRLSLRPRVEWKPVDRIKVRGTTFFKLPLFSPWKDSTSGRTDYRIDTELRTEFSLSSGDGGRFSLQLGIENYYDHAPPRFGDYVAPATHWLYNWAIGVKL